MITGLALLNLSYGLENESSSFEEPSLRSEYFSKGATRNEGGETLREVLVKSVEEFGVSVFNLSPCFVFESLEARGKFLLHEAALSDNLEFMMALVGAGACVTTKDKKVQTPLHRALASGKSKAEEMAIFSYWNG